VHQIADLLAPVAEAQVLFKAPIRLQLPGRRRRSPGNLDRYLTVDKLRQLGFVADSGTVVDCQCRDAGVDIDRRRIADGFQHSPGDTAWRRV